MDEMNNTTTQPTRKNALAIAGMIVGIVSIFWNFYCITGVVGLILSIIGLKKVKTVGSGKGFAIAGIICSAIGIIIGIIAIIAVVALVGAVNDSANEILNSFNSLYY